MEATATTATITTTTAELQLAAIEVPKPELNKSQGFVEWGAQHGFMREVLDLYRHSPTAAAVASRRALFVAGQGFVTDKAKYPNLWAFLRKIAKKGKYRTASKLLRRLAKDFVKLGAFALQVVWSKDGKYITEVYHQRIETVGVGPLNEEEEIDYYLLCRDWSQRQRYKPQRIAAFNPDTAKQDKRQLLFYFNEDTGTEYYPELECAPVLNYMKVEGRLSKHHDARVATRFSVDTLIVVRKGPVDTEDKNTGEKISAKAQRDKFTETIQNKYQGEGGNSIMILWGDGTTDAADKMAKVETITTATPELYDTVASMAKQAILSAFGVTSPVVVGLPGEGGLGGNASELREAFELFFNTVCRPDQVAILETFYDDILPYVQNIEELPGLDDDEPALDIQTTLPIKFMFSEATLENILDRDEMRAMINYSPQDADPAPDNTEEDGQGAAA